jgi:hypothetical protein
VALAQPLLAPLALRVQELNQVGLVGGKPLPAALNCFMQSLRSRPCPCVSCARIGMTVSIPQVMSTFGARQTSTSRQPSLNPSKMILLRHSSVRTLEAGYGGRFKWVEYLVIEDWDKGDTWPPSSVDQARGIRPRPSGPAEAVSLLSRQSTRPWSISASGTAKVGTITSG